MTGDSNVIKKSDLAACLGTSSFQNTKTFNVGCYVMPSNAHYPSLYYLVEEVFDDEERLWGFKYCDIDLLTLEKGDPKDTISIGTLKEYYTSLSIPPNLLKSYAEQLLNGASFEDLGDNASSSALVDFRSKDTLKLLKEETEKALAIAEQIQHYADSIIQVKKGQLESIVSKFNSKIFLMRKEIARYDYVITTIELYAGINEEIIQLREGEPACIDSPLVLHQAVLYMDEEFCLIDDDFDYAKEGSFNEWLVKDGNYKKILTEDRCIIACKPRRTDKNYSDKEWLNFMLNKPNHRTIFLIRNGENIYKLESDNISLDDRMFPNQDELEKLCNNDDHWKEEKIDSFRKLYTRVLFLIQGLIDRSDILSPHNIKSLLIKDLDITKSEGVVLRYELDMSKALSDGHPLYKDWISELNGKLCEGKRIILLDYEFSEDDYIKYYVGKYSAPEYPENGLYVLEDNPYRADSTFVLPKNKKFIIKYLPSDFYRERKNRESIMVDVRQDGILNYDDVKMEDIDYYLNSRLHRSKYYEFIKILKECRKFILKEREREEGLVRMLANMLDDMIKKEIKRPLKDGYTCEQIVREAISEFKDSLKWKRSITEKSKETYYIIKRKVFSKKIQNKYFKKD